MPEDLHPHTLTQDLPASPGAPYLPADTPKKGWAVGGGVALNNAPLLAQTAPPCGPHPAPCAPPPHVNSAMIMWGEGVQNLEWDLGMGWGDGDQDPMGGPWGGGSGPYGRGGSWSYREGG